jgi:hypothetical protein
MCGDHGQDELDPGLPEPDELGGAARGEGPRWTRRQVLATGALTALGAVVAGHPGRASAAATFAGAAPFVAGMHVHAVYSEGAGSWDQQYFAARNAGANVLWQTDHDFRAVAQNYMTKLSGTFLASTTGSTVQHTATFSAQGPIRVLVESAGSSPATQTLAMQDNPNAFNFFRTGIDGQTLSHAFGTSRLDTGATYEVVLPLSTHPAQAGRPAGQYSLRYRFQPGATPRRFTEGNSLVGVVLAPMPANGTTVTLDPVPDIQALWPDLLAIDNVSFGLSFVVTSPRTGVVADVHLQQVVVNRVRHDPAGILAAQHRFASTYSPRYGVTGVVSEELSMGPEAIPHWNRFGSEPEFRLKAGMTTGNWQPYYRDYATRAHASGALVSWNHPLGFSAGPLLSAADQTTRRRQVFSSLLANDLLGADILEVGYNVRGHMPMQQHLALWDTFSRRARWLTGNGVSDDHSGKPWQSLSNGHLTGIWAASTSLTDLVAALRSGRAYVYHPGRTFGLQLDTLVDGSVPMGKASVSTKASRSIAVQLAHLPSGCTVQLVRGPVDLTGQDPGTSVVQSWTSSAFPGGAGTVTASVSTASSCFVRVQVLRNGALTASGNPTWLLRSAPPGGIPGSRAA